MKFRWIIELRGMKIPTMGIIIFGISLFFSMGMILAPLTLPPDSVSDLSGAVTKVDNDDITEDMNPYAKFFYESGDANCHTKSERSYFINGNQMPFCARDVAIFFGMTIGFLITLFVRFELKWWWLIGGLVPIGLDGGIQLLSGMDIHVLGFAYESTNPMRLLTGGIAGIVTSLALGWVVYDMSEMANVKYEDIPGGESGDGARGEETEQGSDLNRYETEELDPRTGESPAAEIPAGERETDGAAEGDVGDGT